MPYTTITEVPVRPRKLRRLLALMAFGAILTGTAFGYAKQAAADPATDYAALYGTAVCNTLDDYPSMAGVTGIGQAIHDDGLTYYQAGQAIGISVAVLCPWHQPLLDQFVAATRSTSRFVA